MSAGGTTTWIVVAIIVLAIVALAMWVLARKQRTGRLRGRFGPEYDRMVDAQGDTRRVEAVLAAREKRVERFHIRPLDPSVRDRFARAWNTLQSRFVDDPAGAVTDADRLVDEVMRVRGYPESASDIELRAADISVDHPRLVENYRAAAEIARRHEVGHVTTEDLRKALVYYRALFEDLLEVQETKR